MKRNVLALLALALSTTALVWCAVPAHAAGQAGSTQVTTFDPTGAVFTCSTGTNYTVLGGIVRSVFHDSFDANGGEHVSGTISPTGVTLTDGTTSTIYRLAGATWFGGTFNAATGQFVFTNTDHFNIIGPTGGVVAQVSAVEHMSSGGANFSFNFGQCQSPTG
jgi:hypothetical protein